MPVSCEVQEGADQSYLTLTAYLPETVQTYTLPVHLKGPVFSPALGEYAKPGIGACTTRKRQSGSSWALGHFQRMQTHWWCNGSMETGKEDASYTYAFAPLDLFTALASPSVRKLWQTRVTARLIQSWRESWAERSGADQRLAVLGEEVISLIVPLLAHNYRPLPGELELSLRNVQHLTTRYSGENLIQVCVQQAQYVVRALTIAAFSEEGSHLKTIAGAFHFRASEIQDALERENAPKERVVRAN